VRVATARPRYSGDSVTPRCPGGKRHGCRAVRAEVLGHAERHTGGRRLGAYAGDRAVRPGPGAQRAGPPDTPGTAVCTRPGGRTHSRRAGCGISSRSGVRTCRLGARRPNSPPTPDPTRGLPRATATP
jgi:hypothetical protein